MVVVNESDDKAGFAVVSPDNIDELIVEAKLLRIFRPDIHQRVETAMRREDMACGYVVESQGQLYLLLDSITDAQERQGVYELIQRYQLGERVSLQELPKTLRPLLQPEATRLGRLMGALILGAFWGLACGILALALAILLQNIFALFGSESIQLFGMGFTAGAFVIFSTLGWVGGTLALWRRWQHQGRPIR